MRHAWIVGILALGVIGCQENKAFSSQFQCGDTIVHFKALEDGKADMKINNTTYALKQVISASGAKYENLGNPNTIFWNKGNKAYVTIDGNELSECTEIVKNPTQSNTSQNHQNNKTITINDIRHHTWQLEDLDQTGIIDRSHITLVLGDKDQMSGSAGCNRYTGRYTLNKEILEVNPRIASTMMACPANAIMQQERRFLDILANITKAKVDDTGALILYSKDGKSLTFRQSTPKDN